MESPNQEKPSLFNSMFKAKYDKITTDVSHISQITKELAQDDPRRVVHSIKVAFAITVVSLFYYFDPLYEGFGVGAMWAVLTVVVVFEFSVGATLGKGVNRVLATILGGMLAVGAHRLSSLPGKKLEPFCLGVCVFITAGVTTFLRFFPKMKARFDYGVLIFILTFSLICVSGYRDDEVIDMAHKRITTILIGSSTSVIVCVVICPVWAGTDLHKLVATNLLTLALFFQEFGVEYFKTSSDEIANDNNEALLDGLKNVLDSKNNLDSLLNLAKWEPRHGRFKGSHPWTQYQKIGELARHCACRAEALHGFIYPHLQIPKEVKSKFRETRCKMSSESGIALKELSLAMKKMTKPSKAKPHLINAKQAAQNLNLLLKSNIWKNLNLSEVTSVATVATLLVDIVTCIQEIADAVEELASLAKFKDFKDVKVAPQIEKAKLGNQGSIKRAFLC
ncbi:hypothetical protein BVRB_7g171110 [Beta vulgaris subsp. vulgaris]|nr:hypothetical protein BVRB_7g171110 [Beta vulgaris subsp. vulgaris]